MTDTIKVDWESVEEGPGKCPYCHDRLIVYKSKRDNTLKCFCPCWDEDEMDDFDVWHPGNPANYGHN
jgi:hypothetical protein